MSHYQPGEWVVAMLKNNKLIAAEVMSVSLRHCVVRPMLSEGNIERPQAKLRPMTAAENGLRVQVSDAFIVLGRVMEANRREQ